MTQKKVSLLNEKLFTCKHCGQRVEDLTNPDNWMSAWRTDSGAVVGQEDRKKHGHSTYLGFVPKPEFRHDCTGKPCQSHTPADYQQLSIVDRVVARSEKNGAEPAKGHADLSWEDLL